MNSPAVKPSSKAKLAARRDLRQYQASRVQSALLTMMLMGQVCSAMQVASDGGQPERINGKGRRSGPHPNANTASKKPADAADAADSAATSLRPRGFISRLQDGAFSGNFTDEGRVKLQNAMYALPAQERNKTLALVETKKMRSGDSALFIPLPHSRIESEGVSAQFHMDQELIALNANPPVKTAIQRQELQEGVVHEGFHFAELLRLLEGEKLGVNASIAGAVAKDPMAQQRREWFDQMYYCVATVHYLAKSGLSEADTRALYNLLPETVREQMTEQNQTIADLALRQLQWFSAYKLFMPDLQQVAEEAIGSFGSVWSPGGLSELGKRFYRPELKEKIDHMLADMTIPPFPAGCPDPQFPLHIPANITAVSDPKSLDFRERMAFEIDRAFEYVYEGLSTEQRAEVTRLAETINIWTPKATFANIVKDMFDASVSASDASRFSQQLDKLMSTDEKRRLLVLAEHSRNSGVHIPLIGSAQVLPDPHHEWVDPQGQLKVSADNLDRSLVGAIAYAQVQASPSAKQCEAQFEPFYYALANAASIAAKKSPSSAEKAQLAALEKSMPPHIASGKDGKGKALTQHQCLIRELERLSAIRAIGSYRTAAGESKESTCGQFVASVAADAWSKDGLTALSGFHQPERYPDVLEMLASQKVSYPLNSDSLGSIRTEKLYAPNRPVLKNPQLGTGNYTAQAAEEMRRKMSEPVRQQIAKVLGCTNATGREMPGQDRPCDPVTMKDHQETMDDFGEGTQYLAAGAGAGMLAITGVAALLAYLRKKAAASRNASRNETGIEMVPLESRRIYKPVPAEHAELTPIPEDAIA